MSNTRRATGNGPLRQERFASSPEYDRGLMANIVARRCMVLDSAADRELVWFLQLLSHKPGGLKKVADDLRTQYADRIATPAMRKFGTKPGQVYSTRQVKDVRAEIQGGRFPLKGEVVEDFWSADALLNETSDDYLERERYNASLHPSTYPASAFVSCCGNAADEHLERHLQTLCLDPAMPVVDGAPWYFPTLVSTLREYQAGWIASRKPAAVTDVGTQVCDALDYASESGMLVLVDGLPRIGKSHAAKAWCEQHPGRARYLEMQSTNDEIGFFRAIAEAIGVSINLNSKAVELRQRIESALQGGDLVLVLDEAHYLWPNMIDPRSLPQRINWLMTALVNRNVPVVLITTPQFLKNQSEFEKRTRWTSAQFIGRIGHYQKLPDSLTPADLQAVAKAFIADADKRTIEALVSYAQLSAKYLAGIKAVAQRAQYNVRKAGRQRVEFKDVMRAIGESVIPSDKAFASAMGSFEKPSRKPAARMFAPPVQPNFKAAAEPELPARQTRPGAVMAMEPNRLEHELVH